jgi:hypothetical protein
MRSVPALLGRPEGPKTAKRGRFAYNTWPRLTENEIASTKGT